MKLTTWNIQHLDRLIGSNLSNVQSERRDAVINEIRTLDPDILCVVEGPKGEDAIDQVASDLLGNDWVAVKADDGEYDTRGTQWIWFLVKQELSNDCSLLPPATWDAFTSTTWMYNPWGSFEPKRHSHYRHPQTLILDKDGQRVEFIGLHLKSKFVNRGESSWNAGGERQEQFIRDALTARVKMTTEATNVRTYIDAKFAQVERPAIFVLGDLNDGPGKEYFETNYLFFDLISNVQGDIFEAAKYLNHALFDLSEDLRWTVRFDDFVDLSRDPHILLDHILFTQPLVDGSLPVQVNAGAGKVEHEIHELINAPLSQQKLTSDHTPVSVILTWE